MKRFLLFLLLTITAASIVLSVFVLPRIVKDLVSGELDKILNTKAEIGRVGLNIPSGTVYFYDLAVPNPAGFREKYFVTIERAHIKFNIPALFSKNFEIEEILIYNPAINIEIGRDSVSNNSVVFKKEPPLEPKPVSIPKKKWSLVINEILLQKGSFKLTNYKLNEKGAVAFFDRLELSVSDLVWGEPPEGMPTTVSLLARLPAEGLSGDIVLKGKGGFLTKEVYFDLDMEARDISLAYFNPFYGNNAMVLPKSGHFDLTSNAKCRSNNLDAFQSVNIDGLELAVNQSAGGTNGNNSVFGLPVASFVSYFVNSNGALDFDFDIKGTLSDPDFRIAESLKKALMRTIGQTISGKLSNLGQAVLDKISQGGSEEDVGNVIKDALDGIINAAPKQ